MNAATEVRTCSLCDDIHSARGLCDVHYQKLRYHELMAAAAAAPPPLRKEDAACCVSKRDELGRLPVGWCGPECSRRPLPGGEK